MTALDSDTFFYLSTVSANVETELRWPLWIILVRQLDLNRPTKTGCDMVRNDNRGGTPLRDKYTGRLGDLLWTDSI